MQNEISPRPAAPIRTHIYAGSPIDRVSDRRRDTDWVAARLTDPDSLFLPVWRGLSLLQGAGAETAAMAVAGPHAASLLAGRPWILLGLHQERAVFAVDLGGADDPAPLVPAGRFEDLRKSAGLLPAADAAMLSHARGMVHWRTRHRFCGVCGEACDPVHAGNVLACTGCGVHHFPRTDPAVIMLVVRGDRALLGHSQRFPETTLYSTLAGFVEPGESLEEAVAREVLEEVGVRVGAVRYHSSQPWPFPASLMLGFVAEAESEDVSVNREELRDARWFSRAEIRAHEAHGFQLPRADSIARRLIEDWLAV